MRGQPCHVGAVVARGKFLHASLHRYASCVERYDGLKWRRCILGFNRYVSELAILQRLPAPDAPATLLDYNI